MSNIRTEIAEFMEEPNRLYDMAERYTVNKYNSSVFTKEEKEEIGRASCRERVYTPV